VASRLRLDEDSASSPPCQGESVIIYLNTDYLASGKIAGENRSIRRFYFHHHESFIRVMKTCFLHQIAHFIWGLALSVVDSQMDRAA